jgi:hypothetical protein
MSLVMVLALACPEHDGGKTSAGESGSHGSTAASSTDASSTSTADTGAGPSSGELGSSSEAALPGACIEAADCRLYSDCCTCDAFASDEEPPDCSADCDRTMCEEWGVTEAICSHTCHLRLVDCDPMLIMCDETPPACDEGFTPSIESRCWTRHCVPVELCTPY